MGSDIKSFTNLLSDQSNVFSSIKKTLTNLIKAAKEKNGPAVSALTIELISYQDMAATLDQRMVTLILESAASASIDPMKFKLSMLDSSKSYTKQLDDLKKLINEVAVLSAQAGGVLSANVDIIEQTIKVLESIDARSTGYGKSPDTPSPRRPSKMIDRTA